MTKENSIKDIISGLNDVLFPPAVDECRILVGCSRADYCASKIAHAVEDCNAQVLNLNVTSLPSGVADLVVDLRVNHRNAEAITRSLARYGYEVLDAQSNDAEQNEAMRQRANELLRYIEM